MRLTDRNVVARIKVDFSKGQTRVFDLPEAYIFDRSHSGSLSPYPDGHAGVRDGVAGAALEDLIEDFTSFYDGRHKLPSFPFKRRGTVATDIGSKGIVSPYCVSSRPDSLARQAVG